MVLNEIAPLSNCLSEGMTFRQEALLVKMAEDYTASERAFFVVCKYRIWKKKNPSLKYRC